MRRISLDIFRIGKTKDERKTRFEQSNEDRVNMNFKRLQQAIEEVNTEKADGGDVYTKTEADALLSEKADASDVYTKAQSDSLLSAKANSADVVPKSGGTFTGDVTFDEDVTVDGVLDVTQRRCYADLPSIGWYRVLTINEIGNGGWGFVVDLNIVRAYDSRSNEVHAIKLQGIFNNFAFVSEESRSNVFEVTKIRYTKDNANTGHVDIYYDYSGTNFVSVDFAVHATAIRQDKFVAESLQAVADAPSGETVLTTYEFSAYGYKSITPTSAHRLDAWSCYMVECGGAHLTQIDAAVTLTSAAVNGTALVSGLPKLKFPSYYMAVYGCTSSGGMVSLKYGNQSSYADVQTYQSVASGTQIRFHLMYFSE